MQRYPHHGANVIEGRRIWRNVAGSASVAKATWFSIGVNIRKGLNRVFLIPTGARFRALPWPAALIVMFFGGCLAFFVVSVVYETITRPGRPSSRQTVEMSPAERLARAKGACGNGGQCLNTNEAVHQLLKIPDSAPESREAAKLWIAIEPQLRQEAANRIEKENLATVSDAERIQKNRNEDAQIHSYWATTVRVDTDMDSFWLPDEERTCQTFPDNKGRVATVTCDATSHATHNIPVKFWGGVDRDTVSNWKAVERKTF